MTPRLPAPAAAEQDSERAARLMIEKADHWYWAEREICGLASGTEPPCVKSVGHDDDHDGTYSAPPMARLNAWFDHQIAEGRAEMARDAAEDAARVIDRTGTSDAEFQARIAPFDAAPEVTEGWEQRVEAAARAIYEADHADCKFTGCAFEGSNPRNYRRLAAAALTADAALAGQHTTDEGTDRG